MLQIAQVDRIPVVHYSHAMYHPDHFNTKEKFAVMNIQRILLLTFALLCLPASAQEDVVVDFQYQGTHSVDLSKMRGPIKIAEFTDGRSVANARLITSSDLGNSAASAGYQAEAALPELIRDAMVQGFKHGGAPLVETDDGMRLVGNLLASDVVLVEREGVPSIQITLRTNVQLQGDGRTIWQTTLFGRGIAPASEGLAAAIHAALDRSIRELVGDDYFLLEIM